MELKTIFRWILIPPGSELALVQVTGTTDTLGYGTWMC